MCESFHSKTHGFGWSQYQKSIDTGKSSFNLIVPIPESALVLINIHNEQILELIKEINYLKNIKGDHL